MFSYESNGSRNVCFDSSSTYHTEDIVSYDWDFGDGTHSNLTNPCHSYPIFLEPKKVYVVSLTVTDERGTESTHYVKVNVSNYDLYLAISIILSVGLVYVGSQWKDIKRRINA